MFNTLLVAAALATAAAPPIQLPEQIDVDKLIKVAEAACPAIQSRITSTTDVEALVDAAERVLIRLDLKPSEQEIIWLACTSYLKGYMDGRKRR